MSETTEEKKSYSDLYFEPNRPPEEILEKKEKQRIVFRFFSEEDIKDFTEKTGIEVIRSSEDRIVINRTTFPVPNNLESFFG